MRLTGRDEQMMEIGRAAEAASLPQTRVTRLDARAVAPRDPLQQPTAVAPPQRKTRGGGRCVEIGSKPQLRLSTPQQPQTNRTRPAVREGCVEERKREGHNRTRTWSCDPPRQTVKPTTSNQLCSCGMSSFGREAQAAVKPLKKEPVRCEGNSTEQDVLPES
jgi:hypothetical protein